MISRFMKVQKDGQKSPCTIEQAVLAKHLLSQHSICKFQKRKMAHFTCHGTALELSMENPFQVEVGFQVQL